MIEKRKKKRNKKQETRKIKIIIVFIGLIF